MQALVEAMQSNFCFPVKKGPSSSTRLTPDVSARLQSLAAKTGYSASTVMRALIDIGLQQVEEKA